MTTYLLDTFQGAAGDLAGHTADSGATWTKLYYNGTLRIDGSGHAVNEYDQQTNMLYQPSIQVTANKFTVEIDFDWTTSAPHSWRDYDACVGVALMFETSPGQIHYGAFVLHPSPEYWNPFFSSLDGEQWVQYPYNPPTQMNPWPMADGELTGAHTLRLDFDGGYLVAAFIDDVQKMDAVPGWYTDQWAVTWAGVNQGIWPGLRLDSGAASSSLKVSRFEVKDTGVPTPPGGFWTEYVLAEETL